MEGVISLGVGEPDFATPWHIREAAIYSLEKGYTMYTSNLGMPELRQELSRHLKDKYGLDYDPDSELLITIGVSEGLDLTMRAILDPGDEVIMPDPCYVSYNPCVALAGGRPIMVPTNQENNFEISAADIEARVTDKTKAILIGYPANPTGAVMPRDKLAQIAEVARRHHLLVVSDEIYARLVYGVEHTCFATLPQMKENTILLGGFSKAYAMTGWRLGYLIAPKAFIRPIQKVQQNFFISANSFVQRAGIAALTQAGPDIEEMRRIYDARRRFLLAGLTKLGFHIPLPPTGAFYIFVNARHLSGDSYALAFELLENAGVGVTPGIDFGPGGEGFLRFSYANSLENLEEALRRLAAYLARRQP